MHNMKMNKVHITFEYYMFENALKQQTQLGFLSLSLSLSLEICQ